ncbi:hypothetical protein ACMHYO_11490 [Allopusillimonas ginsengisoli]
MGADAMVAMVASDTGIGAIGSRRTRLIGTGAFGIQAMGLQAWGIRA